MYRNLISARNLIASNINKIHTHNTPLLVKSHPRSDPSGGNIHHNIRRTSRLHLHNPMCHSPVTKRNRPMSAGGRKAIFMEEQDAEVGARIVGRGYEATVHVCVAAGFVAEGLAEEV